MGGGGGVGGEPGGKSSSKVQAPLRNPPGRVVQVGSTQTKRKGGHMVRVKNQHRWENGFERARTRRAVAIAGVKLNLLTPEGPN